MNEKGFIATRYEFSVWCGICEYEKTLYQGNDRYSKLAAEIDARRFGWRYTKKNGWICPKHSKGNRP